MSAIHTIPGLSTRLVPGGRSGSPRPRRLRDINTRGECPRQSVLALLEEHAQRHPLNRALVMLDGETSRAVTYVELAQRVRGVAAWLTARFPEGGESIAILSESSPAWGIVALATIASRNVLVPLDTSMERDALDKTLRSLRPGILFASQSFIETVKALVDEGAPVAEVLCLDDSRVNVPLPDPVPSAASSSRIKPTPGTTLMAFTSGTTGAPKAVEISFDNLLYQIRALTRRFALRPSDRLLSLLPMHHMFEFTVGFLCPLWAGAQVHYLHSLLPDDALDQIRSLGITRVVTVPAWLGLLRRALARKARAGSAGVSSPSRQRTRVREAFGGEFEHFVSGGAPLADELADFFDAIGAPVVQGYGLTETGPVVATNVMGTVRRGSAGRLLDGTETMIAADGEILVRGPQVAGFYRLDTGAAKSVTDDKGWFHTGDRGHTDEDGFLYVTGRIKSAIVLASGKNVQPEEIENCLEGCDAVAEAGVVALGDANSVPGEEICLVAVPAQAFRGACSEPDGDVEQALLGRIRNALASLAPHKRPRRVILRDQPLPRTATGKLRRPALADWAQAEPRS
jgi:long-chain acyl-CoA synthetase